MLKQTNVMNLGNRNNPSAFQSQVDFLDMMKGIVWDSKLAIQQLKIEVVKEPHIWSSLVLQHNIPTIKKLASIISIHLKYNNEIPPKSGLRSCKLSTTKKSCPGIV